MDACTFRRTAEEFCRRQQSAVTPLVGVMQVLATNFLEGLRVRSQVLAHLDLLLPSLFDALHAPSERVVVEALSVQAAIATDDPQQFRTLMQELIDRCFAALAVLLVNLLVYD